VTCGSIPSFTATMRMLEGGGEEVDLIAVMAIILGLLLSHPSASAMILLMVTGGEALEALAIRRAGYSLRGV